MWVAVSYAIALVLLVVTLVTLRVLVPEIYSVQAQPTATVLTQTTTLVTATLGYADALQTYEKIASSAISASERALNSMQWLMGAIIGLVAMAAASAAYLFRASKDTADKAKSAEVAAQSAQVAAETAVQQLKMLSDEYVKLTDNYHDMTQRYIELKNETLSLDAAIRDWSRGEIPQGKLIESQQWHSWQKWTHEKDETGWLELRENVSAPDGLVPAVRTAIELELSRLRRKTSKSGSITAREKEYEQRLQTLLHASSKE